MKKLIVLAAAAVLLGSCANRNIKMSDSIATKQVDITTQFDAISTSAGVKVVYTPRAGAEVELTISAPDNAIDYVEASVHGSTLTLGMKRGINYESTSADARVTVYVTAPPVSQLEASSSGSIDIRPALAGGDIEMEAKSSGTINFEKLTANKADIEVSSSGAVNGAVNVSRLSCQASSAGMVTLTGEAMTVDLDAASAGIIDASGVKASTGTAKASSAGIVKSMIATPEKIKEESAGRVVNK